MTDQESEKIVQLRRKYQRSLSDKLAELNQLWPPGESRPEGVLGNGSEFFMYVHRLAGSSGMYGYENLSSTSRQVLNQLERHQVDELPVTVSKLRGLLKRLA